MPLKASASRRDSGPSTLTVNRPDAASALLAQAIRLLDRNGAPAWRDRLSVLAAQDAPAP